MKLFTSKNFLCTSILAWVTHVAYSSEQTYNLVPGHVQITMNVKRYAELSKDVADMRKALKEGDREEATKIYNKGKNVVRLDTHKQVALREFSQGAPFQRNTPPYLFHLFGLSSGKAYEQDFDVHREYAHEYVEMLLKTEYSGTLAADAVVVLSYWMKCSYLLWDILVNCRKSDTKNRISVEQFIATYVGLNQTETEGSVLFDVSQRAGKVFGKNSKGYSENNLKILDLFEQLRGIFEYDGTCKSTEEANNFEQTYSLIIRMQQQMMVPLMQMLISALVEEDLPAIRLYSMAVVPQLSQCQRSKFLYLKEKLITDQAFEKASFGRIIGVLQSSFDCLGFTCEEVGDYKDHVLPKCVDIPPPYPLAGYHPSENVHQHAKIDLDIHQIKIFTEMRAWEAVNLLYSYGRNSVIDYESGEYGHFRTLKAMAKTKGRNIVTPFYADFNSFYDDPNYADSIITDGIYGRGRFSGMPTAQRGEIVVMTIQYQVLYMYAMSQMQRSVNDCYSQDPNRRKSMLQAWDESAAYLIGSLEGPKAGGSFADGDLLYSLANKMCKEFRNCSGNGWANSVTMLLELIYAGRGEMDAPDCDAMKWESEKIKHIVLIPVIQAVILYAVRNQYLEIDSQAKQLGEGEAMTKAILPIVNSYASESAEILRRNMVIEAGVKPVQDGPKAVADAMYEVLDDFGISCLIIGSVGGINACKSIEPTSAALGYNGRGSIGLVITLGATAGIIFTSLF